ncbi:major facilitator superfamily domain-containing protein [Morchella snyderi]|nr:major facilitator superfamily domain-containing protein [Morchella snyderi]
MSVSSASSSNSSSKTVAENGPHYVDLESQSGPSAYKARGRGASISSAVTQKDIYQDLSTDDANLRRQETLQELRSVYSRRTENEGELDAPDDASEFKDIDPELITWDGPGDPANPRNFPTQKKWTITLIVSLYTFVSPFASSIAAPAAQAYAKEFGITNTTIASMTVSVFLIGFAFGPLFFAPLSEIFGRVKVMQVSIFLFLVFNIACAVAQTTGQMIAFRLLAGLAGSSPLALGAGILSDIWAPVDLARAMAFFALGPLVGPVCAPIIAGFIVQHISWRWVFWVLSIVTGVTAVVGALIFKDETYAIVILNRKAAAARKATGNENLHTVFEVSRDIKTSFKIALTRPFLMLALNPVLLSLGLFMAFTYGFLYLMFVTFPTLFQGEYGETVGIAGLNYLAPGIGFLLGLATFTPALQKTYLKLTAANGGVAKPEFRLPTLFVGSILISGGLFWYGWSAEKRLHWIMPLIGTSIFSMGLISVFSSVQTYLIDMSPRYAASAISAATLFRSLFGFAFPLFGRQMYDKLGYGWGNSLMGFIALPLGLLFPLMIFRYGEGWRMAAEKRIERVEAGQRASAAAKEARKAQQQAEKS